MQLVVYLAYTPTNHGLYIENVFYCFCIITTENESLQKIVISKNEQVEELQSMLEMKQERMKELRTQLTGKLHDGKWINDIRNI